jgi:lipopolysaccharide export system permease protein
MSCFVLSPLAILLTKRATDDKGFNISFDWITDIYNRFVPAKTEEQSETQEELLLNNNLYNVDYNKVEELHKQYKIFSRITFFVYLIMLGISFLGKPETIVSIIIVMVIAIIFYSALFKSQQLLDEIGTIINKKVDLNLYLVIAAGFPFFILFYLYNRSYLKEVISEYTKSASS